MHWPFPDRIQCCRNQFVDRGRDSRARLRYFDPEGATDLSAMRFGSFAARLDSEYSGYWLRG